MKRLLASAVPRSLRVRIMVTLVGLVATLGVVALANAANDMVDLLEAELERRGIAIARDVAARGAGVAVTNDIFGLYEVVNDTLLNNPDVRYIFIAEPSGEVRVHTFEGAVPEALIHANAASDPLQPSVRVLNTAEGPIIDVAVPVLGTRGTTARVGMSEAGVKQVVAARVVRLGVLVGVAFVSAIGASFVLASMLTRPLVRFAEASRNVARGQLSQKVAVEATDEIGDLAAAFNAMTDALEESRDDLVRRNEELRTLVTMAEQLNRYAASEDLASRSLEQLLALTGYSAGWICLRDRDGQLSLIAASGARECSPAKADRSADCECNDVLRASEPRQVRSSACRLAGASPGGQRDCALLPLVTADGSLGVLAVATDGDLSGRQLDLLISVSHQIAIGLENSRLYGEVQAKERARGELLDKLIAAQEEERKRIAREIHDEPTQALSGIVMRLDQLERHLPREQAVWRAEVDASRLAVRGAIESLHRIMLELRPSVLDDLGLVPAIRWLAEQRLATDIESHVTAELGGGRLAADVEIATFRIVQEAINNISRHAAAQRVSVRIEQRNGALHGLVSDDGRGFEPDALSSHEGERRGLGIAGMKERARLLGGDVQVWSAEHQGTTVAFTIPLPGATGSGGMEVNLARAHR